MEKPRGWHSRGYLPHFDGTHVTQAITFRLADSLPSEILDRWHSELQTYTPEARQIELRSRIDKWLDSGHGECLLRHSKVAELVQNSLMHFDSQRYEMLNWCVMPNHVHTLINPLPGCSISGIVHSWKSFSAKAINHILQRQGQVWMADYFDRYIRDAKHFAAAMRYIDQNPVRAMLCAAPAEWPWGRAGAQHEKP